jgi:hypothetical protein
LASFRELLASCREHLASFREHPSGITQCSEWPRPLPSACWRGVAYFRSRASIRVPVIKREGSQRQLAFAKATSNYLQRLSKATRFAVCQWFQKASTNISE